MPGALPYLCLARACAMQADSGKASVPYEQLFTLRKDGDQGFLSEGGVRETPVRRRIQGRPGARHLLLFG